VKNNKQIKGVIVMPTGKFDPKPVTSKDGKNTWKGRGRKPSWLKKEEAEAAQANATAATAETK
jgi:DNA-binding protein H-NS